MSIVISLQKTKTVARLEKADLYMMSNFTIFNLPPADKRENLRRAKCCSYI